MRTDGRFDASAGTFQLRFLRFFLGSMTSASCVVKMNLPHIVDEEEMIFSRSDFEEFEVRPILKDSEKCVVVE